MSELENRTFTPDDLAKLKETITSGVKIHREMEDLKYGLTELVKAVAETLEIKPKLINAAIRASYKENIADKKADLDDLEELLHIINGKK